LGGKEGENKSGWKNFGGRAIKARAAGRIHDHEIMLARFTNDAI
jgi:hypothetical protein